MIVSVASGKGGTGKTTVAVSLALSISEEEVQFLDCDVEEPNASIFLKPQIEEALPVFIPVPRIDQEKCNFCGKCAEVCAYHALAAVSYTHLQRQGFPKNTISKSPTILFSFMVYVMNVDGNLKIFW